MAERFSVERRQRAGVEQVVLRDAGNEVHTVPALGNACVAFRVGGWSVLSEPPDDEALVARTSRYGVPILYPWPNRVADGRFVFRGREVEVPLKAPGTHANHGLARDHAWELLDAGVDAHGASVRARVRLTHPAFPSVLEVEHRLFGATLRITATAENVGEAPMPMGFGLHPYFDVPAENRARCTVEVPADRVWELDRFIPTGRVLPVHGPLDLRTPRALEDLAWDDVFTDLAAPFAATLRDPVAGRSVVVRSDPAFREHVVYAPADRPVVCLEPYTCPTDAFNLEARGIPAGVVVLDPGRTWSGTVWIEASPGA